MFEPRLSPTEVSGLSTLSINWSANELVYSSASSYSYSVCVLDKVFDPTLELIVVTAVLIVEAAFDPLIVATAEDMVVLAAVAMAVAVAGEGSALYCMKLSNQPML